MRLRTLAVFGLLLAVLAGGGAYALLSGGAGGSLDVVWVSDTPRNTTVNHHGVGANAGVVVAPASEPGGSPDISRYSCSLVRLAPADGATEWRWPVPEDRCFLHALTRPAVADVDGDGGQEVVAVTIEEVAVVLESDGTERTRIPMAAFGYGQPAVADVVGDDRREIVASDIEGGVVVASADGTVRWRGNVSGTVWASPVVVDLDGDGSRDVVVGSNDETVAFASDGSVRWRRSVSARDIAVADTADGPALVTAGADGVAAFDGATGERRWNRSGLAAPSLSSVADGDGDGDPEVYLSVGGSDVTTLDATDGTEQWRTTLTSGDANVRAPVLADLTGDGPALVAATTGGTVAVLDPVDGAELAAYQRDVPVYTAVTPADLTDDPSDEILVRYGDGRVVALRYE